MKIALAALSLLAAAPLSAADQFDLSCEGTEERNYSHAGTPVAFVLHVDLTSSKWCIDKCLQILPIAEVQSIAITFEQETPSEKELGIMNSRLVNRQSGKFIRYRKDRLTNVFVQAQCEKRPFTGFPKVETKF